MLPFHDFIELWHFVVGTRRSLLVLREQLIGRRYRQNILKFSLLKGWVIMKYYMVKPLDNLSKAHETTINNSNLQINHLIGKLFFPFIAYILFVESENNPSLIKSWFLPIFCDLGGLEIYCFRTVLLWSQCSLSFTVWRRVKSVSKFLLEI